MIKELPQPISRATIEQTRESIRAITTTKQALAIQYQDVPPPLYYDRVLITRKILELSHQQVQLICSVPYSPETVALSWPTLDGGEDLRVWSEARGLSPKELGEYLGMRHGHVNRCLSCKVGLPKDLPRRLVLIDRALRLGRTATI